MMNYPAASSGVSDVCRHAGLDPASSPLILDTGFRRYDRCAAKPRGMDPKRFKIEMSKQQSFLNFGIRIYFGLIRLDALPDI